MNDNGIVTRTAKLAKRQVMKIKHALLPSKHDKMVRKWFSDGGDYRYRFDYRLSEDSFVIDLGGYEGQWASDIFARYQCKIAVFEPVVGFANRIAKRFQHNPNIQINAFALGARAKKEEIGVCADGSSIFASSLQREQIEIVDAAEWLTKNAAGGVDLMKLNIEGGEYEVLERLIETGLMGSIANIQVQFHEIARDSDERMRKIQEHLKRTHKATYQYRFVWENWTKKEII